MTRLPGVGEKTAARFHAMGIRTGRDLAFHLPRAYQDRSNPRPIPAVAEGEFATVRGQILAFSERRYRTRKTLEAMVTDGKGTILLKWFRYGRWLRNNLERRFPPGTEVDVSGRVVVFSGNLEMHHPELTEVLPGGDATGIVPVYPLAEGLSQQVVRRAVRAALPSVLGEITDPIPADMRGRFGLPDLVESLSRIHNPGQGDDIQALNLGKSPWHRRLKFGELLAFHLGLLMRRRALDSRTSPPIVPEGRMEAKLRGLLPFELTDAQERALEDVARDMAGETPMHRLLQGDVGSGKTVVAFIAMIRALETGHQAVLMAPTEVLAEQHFRTISGWCDELGIEAGLLTGSVTGARRREILHGASEGSLGLLVGTHALIQEGVRLPGLALAVVDEQHRFGVLQRLALGRKGDSPHFLVMTATPIPRSLSMVVYGDLDISTIAEMPPGRAPVETLVLSESERSRMHLRVSREAAAGRQVYIVYPLVEESEKLELMAASEMAQVYRDRIFPHLRIGLLTGRMSAAEKDAVMEKFRSGEFQVLVSTTVIEVGVDVPNATLMVVEHAERFGLFQLHQLRGRVGRGEHRSSCILMQGPNLSDEARRRLQVVAHSTSGFRIAEEDLRIRGPGDFLGVRQSGMPDFRFAHPFTEPELMTMAREAALVMLPEGGELTDEMVDEVKNMWSDGFLCAASG